MSRRELHEALELLERATKLVEAALAEEPPDQTFVSLVRKLHPAVGHFQLQILDALAHHEPMSAAEVGRAIENTGPNTFLTLKGLVQRGLVTKAGTGHGARYSLGPELC